MYFTLVEKQNSGLLDGWTPRYLAFDTSRRYLYYSENLKTCKDLPVSCQTLRAPRPAAPPHLSAVSLEGFAESPSAISPSVSITQTPRAYVNPMASRSPRSAGPHASAWDRSSELPVSPAREGVSSTTTEPLERGETVAYNDYPDTNAPANNAAVPLESPRLSVPNPLTASTELGNQSMTTPPLATFQEDVGDTPEGVETLSRSGYPVPLRSEEHVVAPSCPRQGMPLPVKWKAKIKVSSLYVFAKYRAVKSADHLYQVEITGATRDLAIGEAPSDYLLSPSSSFDHVPDFSPENRESWLKDPFGLIELFDSLRDQCIERRRQRELAVARQRQLNKNYRRTEDERGPVYGTLCSPVQKIDFLSFNTEKTVVVRFSCEYDYIRFLYVLQLVLGYDQLEQKPFKGYPPVDPRNGLCLFPVPAAALHGVNRLEQCAPYHFSFGCLVGRDEEGKLNIAIKGCYLCLTSDTLFIARCSGTIPTWLHQCSVQQFRYNVTCENPYLAFLSDHAAPDLVFTPMEPPMGQFLPEVPFDAISEVNRIHYVLYQCCYANVEPRRVIQFEPATQPTIRAFVAAMEAERRVPMNFCFVSRRHNHPSCPDSPVNLRNVWRGVGTSVANMDHYTMENAAVPLYETNTNNTSLSTEQVQMVRSLVERHELDEELVGLAMGSVTSLSRQQVIRPSPESPEEFIMSTTSAGRRRHVTADGHDSDTSTVMEDEEDQLYGPGAEYLPDTNSSSLKLGKN